MLQDIFPHNFNNAYNCKRICQAGDSVYIFYQDRVLLRPEGDALRLPYREEVPFAQDLTYLFTLDSRPFFLARSLQDMSSELTSALTEDMIYQSSTRPPKEVTLKGLPFISCRMHDLRKDPRYQKEQYFAATVAFHLYRWYEESRFCGHCGSPLTHSAKERAMICPSCHKTYYPRIMPAVIVGVIDKEKDRLLITRYANRPIPYDALVAGFTEIGETLEETVRREVEEETGLHVTNIRYYKSQPWGIVSDLLAGFYCDVEGDSQVQLDEELKEAAWLSRDEITGQPDDLSLTNEMMLTFRDGKEPQ